MDDRNGRQPRCRAHRVNHEHYIPQLRRLLDGAARERQVYYSFIDEVVAEANPLDLFQGARKLPGMYFIEALYLTHAEFGDDIARPSLAPLGYSRWVAWRRFQDAIRTRDVRFPCRVDHYVKSSRLDVMEHVRSGWCPEVLPEDPELLELLWD